MEMILQLDSNIMYKRTIVIGFLLLAIAGDVAFALAPVTQANLDDLLAETWAGRKLNGYRQHKPADIDAVRSAIIRLGLLMADHPVIAEIEVNPLRVLEEGQGCWVVDARMVIESGR